MLRLGGVGEVVLTLDDGHDSALLNSRGTLETVSVDALIPKSVFYVPNLWRRLTAQFFSPRRSSDLRFISSKESTVSS